MTLMREMSREYPVRHVGVLLVLPFLACSSKLDHPAIASGTPYSAIDADSGVRPAECVEGQTRGCNRTLPRHGSVLSCFVGTQTCTAGEWSECTDGNVRLTSLPLDGQRRLTNLSQSPASCSDSNPCDPSCQTYQSGNDAPLVATLTTTSSWWTGDFEQLPEAVKAVLSGSECKTAADCQSNRHCIDVSTAADCDHDKCAQGVGLFASCDPCVHAICEQQPACCDTTAAPACAAGELSDGAGKCFLHLDTAQTWQDARASCRAYADNWDLACITSEQQLALVRQWNQVDSWLGVERTQTGAGFQCTAASETPLDAGLVAGVPPWNLGEPNNAGDEDCVEIYGPDRGGFWNDLYCSYPLPAWCAGPPTDNRNWRPECVAAVASTCGATCSSGLTQPNATCQSWAPRQTNPNDTSFDLALDVPCGGLVPVCNHGTVAAPAQAVIHVFDPDTPFIGRSEPDVQTERGHCLTESQIEPGTCANVSGCSDLLQNDVALWVQAPGGTESRTDDNWGYSQRGAACVHPHCVNVSLTQACVQSRTITDDYVGVCSAIDAIAQWGYLQFRALTPGDSSIRFQVAAAPSEQELDTAIPIDLVTASAATGIGNCLFTGPAPNCPVDLYRALLPQGLAQSQYLRLIITLVPSSDGTQSPVLDYWRINYACPDAT